MKKQLILILFSIITTYAAEYKIDLSNANNDMLSLFLSYVPAEHPLISELTRTRNCNSDLYDRIIEAYLQKLDLFYIEEKDIKIIVDQRFSISANNKIKSEIYRRKINAAFMRYIAKYPYYYIIKHVENFDGNIVQHLKVALKYFFAAQTLLSDRFRNITQETADEFLNELKKEKKFVNNLRLFIASNEERILYKIKTKNTLITPRLILFLITFINTTILACLTSDQNAKICFFVGMVCFFLAMVLDLFLQHNNSNPNTLFNRAKENLNALTILCAKCDNSINNLLECFKLILENINLQKIIAEENKLILKQ